MYIHIYVYFNCHRFSLCLGVESLKSSLSELIFYKWKDFLIVPREVFLVSTFINILVLVCRL